MSRHSGVSQKTFQTKNRDIFPVECELNKSGDGSWEGVLESLFVNFGFLNVNFKLPFEKASVCRAYPVSNILCQLSGHV